MFEKQRYDSPPMYSPPYSPASNGYGPPESFHASRAELDPYPPPPGSYYVEDKPQHFYKWLSPPGIVKAMEGLIIVLCLGIFACVASTLVWDYQYGYGMGGYGMGGYGSGLGYGSGYGYGSNMGYGYGGGYYNSYPTPYSAKSSMIAMAAINFVGALGFFIATFSKSSAFRSRKFYLVVLVVSAILAVLQGIINIVYIVGVNPMAQSSSSIYNPMVMMCQQMYGSGVSGMGGVGGFPIYNQYLYHYCYVDPQEAVAMVCGFMVVVALIVVAVFSFKIRSKIWRYGKPNIYWEEPLTRGPEGRDVEDWVNNVDDNQSVQDAPTVVISEKVAPPLNKANSLASIPPKTDSGFSPGSYSNMYERSISRPSEPHSQFGGASSSYSEEANGTVHKPSARRGKRRRRNPELDESQYETEYTTGGETANEVDQDHWESLYPEIASDAQRQEYKREFDTELKLYKHLCAEMDDINDQLNKLNRELDTLDEGSAKYQAVAEEYNHIKDLKRMPEYQSKKVECRQLRHKLFHIKRMVKDYDRSQQ
ncbi:occludin isoform X2 [Denticeps clupeoides]|uniref:Occludin n=2 Tax=Denticeps clupeoides TaxID=299321 RepID=A0AAY4DL79_9TELE|nr:occludin-like isoform X2 [Denticeps clupeoides]